MPSDTHYLSYEDKVIYIRARGSNEIAFTYLNNKGGKIKAFNLCSRLLNNHDGICHMILRRANKLKIAQSEFKIVPHKLVPEVIIKGEKNG